MLFSWLLRKGLVGAISRDLALKYLTIQRQNPNLEEEDIVERVWQLWLSLNEIHIKNEKDQEKFIRLEVLNQQETNTPNLSALKMSRRSLLDVFVDVLYVEAEVHAEDGKLFERALRVFLAESKKLGVDCSRAYESYMRTLRVVNHL